MCAQIQRLNGDPRSPAHPAAHRTAARASGPIPQAPSTQRRLFVMLCCATHERINAQYALICQPTHWQSQPVYTETGRHTRKLSEEVSRGPSLVIAQ